MTEVPFLRPALVFKNTNAFQQELASVFISIFSRCTAVKALESPAEMTGAAKPKVIADSGYDIASSQAFAGFFQA